MPKNKKKPSKLLGFFIFEKKISYYYLPSSFTSALSAIILVSMLATSQAV